MPTPLHSLYYLSSVFVKMHKVCTLSPSTPPRFLQTFNHTGASLLMIIFL